MTDIKDILNQIIPKPTYFEIDEKDGTKIPFGSLSQLYTNCESYRLNFHCDRFFTNTNISDGLRCVKTKKSPSNSYPIGKYDKNNPFFIVFTNEQDLQSSMEPNIEVDWDYPLVVSDCCEDYRGAEEYFLVVEKEKIILKSRSERGLYYALVTLKKISEMTNGFLIPLKIHDAPKLHLRSVHMDLKRGVPKVSFLKEQAKILSEHKINSFMIEW